MKASIVSQRIKNPSLITISLLAVPLTFFIKLLSSEDLPLVLTTFVYETSSVGFLVGILFLIQESKRLSTQLFTWLIRLILIFHIGLTTIQSFYLDDAFERGMNLSSLNARVIGVFFSDIFPLYNLLIVIALCGIAWFGSLFLNELTNYCKKHSLLLVGVSLSGMLLIPELFSQTLFSPYINSLKTLRSEQISIRTTPRTGQQHIESLDRSEQNIFSSERLRNIRYDRVLVFVMESVMFQHFQDEMRDNPDGYLARMQDHTIYFDNYFTTNQDSRTALTSVLSSVFIPYEAYAQKGNTPPYYKRLLENENLVSGFNDGAYRSLFAISSLEIPTIGRVYPWQKTIHLEQYPAPQPEYLCLHILKNQHGCEDRVLQTKIVDALKDYPKVFMLQEFVFGHGIKYERQLKKTKIQYYNDYLGSIDHALTENGLTERTLVVLVGDHGFRRKSGLKETDKYRVPLAFISRDLIRHKESRLFSHLDFSNILLEIASGGSLDSIKAAREVFILGSTGTSSLQYIDNHAAFFSTIIGSADTVTLQGPVESFTTNQISSRIETFYAYRTRFASRYGTPYTGAE